MYSLIIVAILAACVFGAVLVGLTLAGYGRHYTKVDALQDEIEARKFDIRVKEEVRKLRMYEEEKLGPQ